MLILSSSCEPLHSRRAYEDRKLDAHHQRCRAPFTCLDCSSIFNNPQAWKPHTTCISEAEKYERSVYKGKGAAGKGKGKAKGQGGEVACQAQGGDTPKVLQEQREEGAMNAQADAAMVAPAVQHGVGVSQTVSPAETSTASTMPASRKSKKRKEVGDAEGPGTGREPAAEKKSKKDRSNESAEQRAARKAAKARSEEVEQSSSKIGAEEPAKKNAPETMRALSAPGEQAKESKEERKARKEERRRRKEQEKAAKRAGKAIKAPGCEYVHTAR